MKEMKMNVSTMLGYADHLELNKLANALQKMAYQKGIENRLAIAKAARETHLITEETYRARLAELWADSLRAD